MNELLYQALWVEKKGSDWVVALEHLAEEGIHAHYM